MKMSDSNKQLAPSAITDDILEKTKKWYEENIYGPMSKENKEAADQNMEWFMSICSWYGRHRSAVKDGNLPISRLLTISTGHVKEDTFEALSLDGIRKEIGLPVYDKTAPDNGANYGLFIYIEPGCIDWECIPEDLVSVLKFCMKNNCDVLCLDSDGMELEELPVYEWKD